MKLNFVTKARKPQGSCLTCGSPILPGDSYQWHKPRNHPLQVFCATCPTSLKETKNCPHHRSYNSCKLPSDHAGPHKSGGLTWN